MGFTAIDRKLLVSPLSPKVVADPNSGCWLWIGGTLGNGYGRVYGPDGFGGRRSIGVHRLSYEINRGPIPSGLQLLHKCDTPLCINPDHLRPGTWRENMEDMVRKGRHFRGKRKSVLQRKTSPRGSAHWAAKLDEDTVLKVLKDSRQQKVIAAEYGIDRGSVSRIKSGKEWRHVWEKFQCSC